MTSSRPSSRIIYTETDESPALATYSLLPIVQAYSHTAGINVETRDISLTGRIIANFPDNLTENQKQSDALVIIAPPYTHLSRVNDLIDGVKLGAQNCASEESGAYTGEIAPDMLVSVGVEFVIIGHSERRSYYHEDNELLNKKTKIALSKGLKPIFCCGEVLEEREGGLLFDVIREQLSVGLAGLSKEDMSKIVIAYEPVWAIGTGVTASPEQAQESRSARAASK